MFNHPGTSTGRGRNFVDKDKLKTFKLQLFKIIFLQAFSLRIHSTLEKKLWCIFLKTLSITQLFHQAHAGVKLTLQPAQTRDLSLKVGTSGQAIIFFLGVQWDKNIKIEMLIFTKSGNFHQRNFVSLKLIFSENPWKVLEYECCTEN